ncbi:MAG: helix-turn-helix transcriptional regulator [Lentisphaerota bacterium]
MAERELPFPPLLEMAGEAAQILDRRVVYLPDRPGILGLQQIAEVGGEAAQRVGPFAAAGVGLGFIPGEIGRDHRRDAGIVQNRECGGKVVRAEDPGKNCDGVGLAGRAAWAERDAVEVGALVVFILTWQVRIAHRSDMVQRMDHANARAPEAGSHQSRQRIRPSGPACRAGGIAEFSGQSRGQTPTLDHFLLSLVLRISPALEGPFDKCPSWLRDACVLMSKPENFRKGANHFEVMSGRTLAHVSRVLRQTTGKTPVEWITAWRMGYAAEKLSAASEPIHEIAIECGFRSLGRFYSVFTAWHGISPRRYSLKSSHAFPP